MNNINKTERKSNFDLMRVICILLIVMYHYVFLNGYLYKPFCPQKLFYSSTGIWGLAGVIGFIMVSSHFLYSYGSFSLQKVIRLVFETSFFSTSLTLLLVLIGMLGLGGDLLLKHIFSVSSNLYWFITTYVIFYFLSPFLKLFCDNISILNHRLLLIVLFLITFIIREITHTSSFSISRIDMFIYTYILTAYFIKKPDNIFQKHYKLISVLVFGSIISLVCLFIYLDKNAADATYLNLITNMTYISSTAMVLAAVCMYFIFKNMKIRYSRVLSMLGNSTLGIYLIHEHDFFHTYLFDNILKRTQVYGMSLGPLIYLVSCIGIVFGCALIYTGIRFVFKKTVYMLTDKYLSQKYKVFDAKYVPGQDNNHPA